MESTKQLIRKPSVLGRVWVGLVLVFLSTAVHSQTFAEWWNQKKTQISYLEQQIAALSVYGKYIKQGYQISQNGLGSISNWARGEFNLHSDYYASLKAVNPVIKNDPKAAAILQYAAIIPGQFDQVNTLPDLSGEHRQYIGTVQQKLLDECSKDISELQLVMTPGKAQMTDDERIKRLDQLYAGMKNKFAFTMTFCSEVRLFLSQEKTQQQELKTERRLYEVN